MKKIWVMLGVLVCLASGSRAETVQSGLLMAATRYQTPYFIKTGAEKGPTVVVVGGVHGDETASYLAADQLQKWPVQAGKLVLVPEAHIEAIRRKVRAYPRNMNALFPGKPNGDAMERLAYEIWQVIKASKPDLVLTLHESRGFYAEDKSRYGQTFTYDFAQLKPRFDPVLRELNAQISVAKWRFGHKIEPHFTCPTYCAYKYLHVPSTSIETARPLPLSERVKLQLLACRAFFDAWGLKLKQTG